MVPPYMANLGYVKLEDIRTQKARGYKLLHEGRGSGYRVSYPYGEAYLLPQNLNGMPSLSSTKKWFARPCPLTPRHGFVESRPIKDWGDAKRVFEQARAVDPDAEVLVVEQLSGKYSGIATNVGVTWGWGNDGVTSGGKGNTYHIPTPMTSVDSWLGVSRLGSDSHYNLVAKGDTGYVELVESAGEVRAVQYRSGPPQPTTPDFIPERVKVERLLYHEYMDLLLWEKMIKSLRNTKGVVVSDYKGALSSHYNVHAIAAGIPVVTSKLIDVGDILESSQNRPTKFAKADYRKLGYLIDRWLVTKQPQGISPDSRFYKNQEMLATSIATLHAMSSWDNAEHLLVLRAYAIPTMLRFMAAACIGELRHWNVNGPGRYKKASVAKLPYGTGTHSDDRSYVYKKMINATSLRYIRQQLAGAAMDFNTPGWEGRQKYDQNDRPVRPVYGYGGPMWGEAAKAGAEIAVMLEKFLTKPKELTWSNLVMACNRAVNTMHNNGKTLSKWISDSDLSRINRVPAYGLMNATAAEIALGIYGPTIPAKKKGTK